MVFDSVKPIVENRFRGKVVLSVELKKKLFRDLSIVQSMSSRLIFIFVEAQHVQVGVDYLSKVYPDAREYKSGVSVGCRVLYLRLGSSLTNLDSFAVYYMPVKSQ